MTAKLPVSVLGATGTVGQKLVSLLAAPVISRSCTSENTSTGSPRPAVRSRTANPRSTSAAAIRPNGSARGPSSAALAPGSSIRTTPSGADRQAATLPARRMLSAGTS